MRILVTGGAGFIGSHLAKRFLKAGHEVVIVDNLTTGHRRNLPPEARFIELDLVDPGCIKRLPTAIDVVCHLAAQSAGAVSAEQPYYDLQANAGSTLLLTRWCLQQGIRRFIYASSMAVYGNTAEPLAREATPCLPNSYYGISKLTSEHLLRMAAKEGLKTTAFRIFTVYGPGQDLGNLKQGMVSIYLAYLLKEVTVPVTGSLERFRDFICVDDVVEAWFRAALKTETPRPVYNLGTGRPTTVRELLGALKRALGLPTDHPIQELPGSPADQFGLYADITKIQEDLEFEPRVSLDNGLKEMATWAKNL